MAFVKMVVRGDGKQVAEVFVKGEELIRVLRQQGINNVKLPNNEDQFCLTFIHSELERDD